MLKNKYGWKRGLPVFGHPQFEKACMIATPARADVSVGMPAVYNQGSLGSCTANAGGALAAFLTKKLGWKEYMPSRLALYYWTRQLEGTVSEDSGASLADTARILHDRGVPNETNWPYIPNRFANPPTAAVIKNGLQHIVLDPLQVRQSMDDIRACIAFGFPIIFGFTVYESFESNAMAHTGIMSMPQAGEEILGGHAVVACGYDDYTKMVKVRNSWGTGWGQKGYFQMPYDYIENPNLADDFWTAHFISGYKHNK